MVGAAAMEAASAGARHGSRCGCGAVAAASSATSVCKKVGANAAEDCCGATYVRKTGWAGSDAMNQKGY